MLPQKAETTLHPRTSFPVRPDHLRGPTRQHRDMLKIRRTGGSGQPQAVPGDPPWGKMLAHSSTPNEETSALLQKQIRRTVGKHHGATVESRRDLRSRWVRVGGGRTQDMLPMPRTWQHPDGQNGDPTARAERFKFRGWQEHRNPEVDTKPPDPAVEPLRSAPSQYATHNTKRASA